jgi:hypothetical protein
MRKPTPETTSIMKTERGSTTISIPARKSPAESQVQSVEEWLRSSGPSPSKRTKVVADAANETRVAPEAITPAWKRVMRMPASAITSTAAAGAKSAIQAAAIIRAKR